MDKQKVAIVTGGLQGIGRSIAHVLRLRGDMVIVFDHVCKDDPRVKSLLEDSIMYCRVDISSCDSIARGFENFEKMMGKNVALDILVNNAAITKDTLAVRMSEEDWDSVLDVNLKGLFFSSQHALKIMMRRKKGYIINMSSIVGLSGNPGQAQYAASKAGVLSLTKTLAYEYGSRGICINAIAPGFIQTPLSDKLSQSLKDAALQKISLKRFGEVLDIAYLVEFLSSGKADYITGAVIAVDGGLH